MACILICRTKKSRLVEYISRGLRIPMCGSPSMTSRMKPGMNFGGKCMLEPTLMRYRNSWESAEVLPTADAIFGKIHNCGSIPISQSTHHGAQ